MKLNYKGRQKLRKEVEARLSLVPGGERIKLPKETLEQLLFEVANYPYEDKTICAKHLVWSGYFLNKVDLSEVSFDDVIWDCAKKNIILSFTDDYFDDENIPNYYKNVDKICLAGTNAKIDFYKSAGYQVFNNITIRNCDFSGIDLSNNVLDISDGTVICIDRSNLNNTGIRFIGSTRFGYTDDLTIINTSLINTNFSECTISLEQFNRAYLQSANFSNSGLKIDFEGNKLTNEMTEYLKKYGENFERYRFNPYVDSMDKFIGIFETEFGYQEFHSHIYRFWLDNFAMYCGYNEHLNKRYLDGCYVNGKRIPTEEEREATKAQLLGEYQQFEDETISSVLGEIDTAIKAIRK